MFLSQHALGQPLWLIRPDHKREKAEVANHGLVLLATLGGLLGRNRPTSSPCGLTGPPSLPGKPSTPFPPGKGGKKTRHKQNGHLILKGNRK